MIAHSCLFVLLSLVSHIVYIFCSVLFEQKMMMMTSSNVMQHDLHGGVYTTTTMSSEPNNRRRWRYDGIDFATKLEMRGKN